MSTTKKPYDAVIIGGGHNGLVCAYYLAKAGMRIKVCERRSVVGGAAVTEEFHPGFKNSVASYTVSLLNPEVIKDMRLKEYGLKIVKRPISNFLPIDDSTYLKLGGGLERTQEEFRKFSTRDAERLPEYYDRIEAVADVLRDISTKTPPNTKGGIRAALQAAIQLWPVARGSNQLHQDLLDLFTKSARSFLDAWFENEHVKAAFGFDAIVGNYASPDTPGSAYVLLHHVFGEVDGEKVPGVTLLVAWVPLLKLCVRPVKIRASRLLPMLPWQTLLSRKVLPKELFWTVVKPFMPSVLSPMLIPHCCTAS